VRQTCPLRDEASQSSVGRDACANICANVIWRLIEARFRKGLGETVPRNHNPRPRAQQPGNIVLINGVQYTPKLLQTSDCYALRRGVGGTRPLMLARGGEIDRCNSRQLLRAGGCIARSTLPSVLTHSGHSHRPHFRQRQGAVFSMTPGSLWGFAFETNVEPSFGWIRVTARPMP